MPPPIELRDLVKDYRGLRPLRVRHLVVRSGEVVTLAGPDETVAQVLTDLVTGTTLPDSGEVLIDGRSTAAVSTHDEWLAFLDRFGIVSSRVVLLDGLSVEQNLAIPLTLDVDPLEPGVRLRTARLAGEVGLERDLPTRLGDASSLAKLRVRLGRALAHDPGILLLEHPSLGLGADEVETAARAIAAAARRRKLAVLAITSDRRLSDPIASRALIWRPGTGEVVALRGWRRWLPSRLR